MAILKSLAKIGAGIFSFFKWIYPFFRAVTIYSVSKMGMVFTALFEMIKKIGISTIIAFSFFLGFILTAVIDFAKTKDIGTALISVARVFVAAESEAANIIQKLVTTNPTTFQIIVLYISLVGSFLVFLYVIRALNWGIPRLLSNTSISGTGLWVLSIALILLFESMFLIVVNMQETQGVLGDIDPINVLPGQGIRALIEYRNELPGIEIPYLTPKQIDNETANVTIDELTNISTAQKPRGVVSTLFCAVVPMC